MLALTVTNKLETQQLSHKSGPLEVGRGPAREGVPRTRAPERTANVMVEGTGTVPTGDA